MILEYRHQSFYFLLIHDFRLAVNFVIIGLTYNATNLTGNLHLKMFMLYLAELPALLSTKLLNTRLGRRYTVSGCIGLAGICLLIVAAVPKGRLFGWILKICCELFLSLRYLLCPNEIFINSEVVPVIFCFWEVVFPANLVKIFKIPDNFINWCE